MGRPPKWESPEQLEKEITAYLTECAEKEKMPTKAGLALYLDTTRETLGDYLNKDKFSYAIKKAYSHIEEAWSQRLPHANAAGSIFYLKAAFQYRDRMDITSDDKVLPTPILAHVHNNDSDEEAPETSEEN